MNRWLLPASWEWRTLTEVSEINPRRPSIVRTDNTPTSFVPMEDVDELQGKFKQLQTRLYGEVKRGYTYFEENDVLFAKITPSMQNGKTAIATGLIDGIGFGSTEFHVLRPHSNILPEYLHYYIRRVPFREEAQQHFRGAVGQQRVPGEFLVDYPIPVPYSKVPEQSLLEQRRIVARIEALLREVQEMRKLHGEVSSYADGLMQAVLNEAFELSNVDSRHIELRQLVEVAYGKGLPKRDREEHGTFKVYGSNGVVGSHTSAITRERAIVIGRKGSVGAIHFSEEPCWPIDTTFYIDQYPDSLSAKYLSYYLKSQDLASLNIHAAIPGIRRDDLYRIEVPIPIPDLPDQSLAYQEALVTRVETFESEIEAMAITQAEEAGMLRQLEQAILTQAFSGEL